MRLRLEKWINQIGTVQRARDIRWGIHFQSLCSWMRMFGATCSIINTISNEITNALCQSLQQNSQDIVNAISLISTTKILIQKLRDDRWEPLLVDVKSFCEQHQIDISNMNGHYTRAQGKFRRQVDKSLTTMKHYFRINIFTATIGFQLQALNNRFNDHTIELLILSTTLNSKGVYKLFNIDDIYKLVEKFYPQDFTKKEKFLLRIQLQDYELDLICLVLTLPISTTSTEQAFSAIKLIKTRLCTRMKDKFLVDHVLVYIEKEIAKNCTSYMIVDKFYSTKDHRQA
ncbi:hypothetical protein I3760_04G164300 [Carya illinoinensis]|nr:hypothetical protein I3760_04G164300 [Carya illinoinensis]